MSPDEDKVPTLPSIWNIPYQRNPFFTGREDVLKRLHETLTAGKTAALTQPQAQAISGLGGIGKTQTAVEYAYLHGSEYQAILWAKADSCEVLISDFVSIADLLNLPEKNEQDQNRVVNAAKRWLQTHTDWLLILDNVEDLELVNEFVPTAAKGHVLLTTLAQATGSANRVDIHKMGTDEGAMFLLHRAKIISPSDIDSAKAKEISREMDGLPLALDQAGAYIEETACTLSEYLDIYTSERTELLEDRGEHTFNHPESVVTTFSLAFEKVKETNPAAAELLRLCAFLYPDDIPEEIITDSAPALGSVLQAVAAKPHQLKKAIAGLLKYSLIRRDSEAKMLSIHRLVQAVLKDEMDEDMRHQWAERTVRAVSCVFPEVDYGTWTQCECYLSQTQGCAELIDHYGLIFPEAADLLRQTGIYLHQRARYNEAEPRYQGALGIREQVLGPEHPSTASTLHELASLYQEQGKHKQAEFLYQRALAIWEKTLGPNHPNVASGLANYAALLRRTNRETQAEELEARARAIRQKHAQANTDL